MPCQKYYTADPILYPLLKDFAAENRNHQTEAERLLWKHLSNNQLGLHFRRQHIIDNYIADFACLSRKLIIEVDGGYHSQNSQIQLDCQRTERLESLGFRVLRFSNDEILSNLSECLDIIFDNFFIQ